LLRTIQLEYDSASTGIDLPGPVPTIPSEIDKDKIKRVMERIMKESVKKIQ